MLSQLLARYTEEPSEEERDIVRWATGALFAGKPCTLAYYYLNPFRFFLYFFVQNEAGTDTVRTLHKCSLEVQSNEAIDSCDLASYRFGDGYAPGATG
jgi:hypothetical protein